jgi:hypothetical protein
LHTGTRGTRRVRTGASSRPRAATKRNATAKKSGQPRTRTRTPTRARAG